LKSIPHALALSSSTPPANRALPATPKPESNGAPDLLDELTFAQLERETRLTLAAVTLVGLQRYLQGLDQELFTHVTRAALRAAALRAESSLPEAGLGDPGQAPVTEQGLGPYVSSEKRGGTAG
jgi:hypothetical protein